MWCCFKDLPEALGLYTGKEEILTFWSPVQHFRCHECISYVTGLLITVTDAITAGIRICQLVYEWAHTPCLDRKRVRNIFHSHISHNEFAPILINAAVCTNSYSYLNFAATRHCYPFPFLWWSPVCPDCTLSNSPNHTLSTRHANLLPQSYASVLMEKIDQELSLMAKENCTQQKVQLQTLSWT